MSWVRWWVPMPWEWGFGLVWLCNSRIENRSSFLFLSSWGSSFEGHRPQLWERVDVFHWVLVRGPDYWSASCVSLDRKWRGDRNCICLIGKWIWSKWSTSFYGCSERMINWHSRETSVIFCWNPAEKMRFVVFCLNIPLCKPKSLIKKNWTSLLRLMKIPFVSRCYFPVFQYLQFNCGSSLAKETNSKISRNYFQ